MAVIDTSIIGQKFQSLTVLPEYQRLHIKHGTIIKWLCECDCGNRIYVVTNALKQRKQPFCDQCRPRGIRNERLYHILYGMRQRCENPNNAMYKHYGERGIKVCDEWKYDYPAFRQWALDHGWRDNAGLSIDRIDNDGIYCPENCQIITIAENTAKADRGKVKNHSKLKDVYAISPDGERVDIPNIAAFAREHPELAKPSIHAALHGRMPCRYRGWLFHSNQSRPESVTTIESTATEKSCEREASRVVA